MTAPGLFVTGTDTGVGKTLVACALLHAYRAHGVCASGMKPVAAGARQAEHGLSNEDVERLIAASGVAAPRWLINVYCFEPPVAPHIAARRAGMVIDLTRIEHAFRELRARADRVIVEGVGGFCVPLNDMEDTADLAVRLGLPVVLVVGLRLGCLNHALLSAAAIRGRGLHLAGWIANHIDPAMACGDENVAALAQRLSAPCIARIPYQPMPDPRDISRQFRIDRLLECT